MTKDDIKKVLKAHKKWLDSSGEKGAKAKFVDAYLCGADLYKADLRNANLKRAKLHGSLKPSRKENENDRTNT